MKKNTIFFLLVVMIVAMTGCHEDHEDYDTTAAVNIVIPDSIKLEKMQGTVTLRNLSNGYKYASSTFNLSTTNFQLLRGAYSLDAEGTLVFTNKNDKNASLQIRYFRATLDYVEITQHPIIVLTRLILM